MFRRSIRTLVIGLCALTAATPAATAVALTVPVEGQQAAHAAARVLNPQTLTDLDTTMKGEAFAYASYSLFAIEADRQSYPAVAKLFRGTARTELNEHFREAAALAGTVGSNAANLRQAINGETYEHQVMYRRFAAEARADGDLKAAELFTEIAADEGREEASRTTVDAAPPVGPSSSSPRSRPRRGPTHPSSHTATVSTNRAIVHGVRPGPISACSSTSELSRTRSSSHSPDSVVSTTRARVTSAMTGSTGPSLRAAERHSAQTTSANAVSGTSTAAP
ncbi:hypothetical protein SANTM175S_10480 [Streptomyces antimycoticus]